jgi:hypothetical protein
MAGVFPQLSGKQRQLRGLTAAIDPLERHKQSPRHAELEIVPPWSQGRRQHSREAVDLMYQARQD